jgi:hypothetical protein
MRDSMKQTVAPQKEILDEREAREVVGAGKSFGSLLHVKQLPERGAAPVLLQGCGSDGGSSCA